MERWGVATGRRGGGVGGGSGGTRSAYGPAVRSARGAAGALATGGRGAQVVGVRTLTPFDDATVCAAVRSTGRAVVIAEAPGFASVASEIQARVFEQCFEYLEAPVRRATGFDTPFASPKFEHWYLPDVDRVLDAVDSLHFAEVAACAPRSSTCPIWVRGSRRRP